MLICLPYLPAFADSADAAQARVQASHAALQAAEGDYRQRRARGGLSPGEAADYRSYIAHLRQRFFGACADLATFSPRWFAFNTPCPAQAPTYSRPASIDQAREQTPGERVTAHARDLDASLGEFDEMLLREQERVKAATPPPTASASARGSGAGSEGRDGRDGRDGREGAEDGERGEGAVAGRGPAGEATGDNASASAGADGTDVGVVAAGRGGGAMPPGRAGSQGGGQHRTAQNTPRDIPDGSDDDVVARQLREAAEAERDPELRARLWDEYRRYKRGTR